MQSLIFSNQVLICWTEDLASFDTSLFKTEFQILIVIEPQITRLYRVKLFAPSSVCFFSFNLIIHISNCYNSFHI